MPLIPARVGEAAPLVLVLEDSNASKFPEAEIFDDVGTVTPIATIPLANISKGFYFGTWTVTAADKFVVVYTVYEDAGRTVLSLVNGAADDLISADVPEDPDTIVAALAEAQLNIAFDCVGNIFRAAGWMDRGGQTVTNPTTATIEVRRDDHSLLFTQTTASSTNGVFVFVETGVVLVDDRVHYVEVTVTDPLGTVSTVQSFSTVSSG